MRYFVTVEDRTFEVELGPEGVTVDGKPVRAELAHVPGTEVRSLLVDGRSHRVLARKGKAGLWRIELRGQALDVQVLDERARAIREMTGAGAGPAGPRPIRAPMPGLVVKVEVSEGDRVAPGQGVVIVEAMKMENELKAEGFGVVSRVLVAAGEPVEKDQVLIELSPVEPEGGG